MYVVFCVGDGAGVGVGLSLELGVRGPLQPLNPGFIYNGSGGEVTLTPARALIPAVSAPPNCFHILDHSFPRLLAASAQQTGRWRKGVRLL